MEMSEEEEDDDDDDDDEEEEEEVEGRESGLGMSRRLSWPTAAVS